ncbi:MAG TPA: hypothetical protein VKT28_06585, partial [Puia sp.]|nr:hypothetical protein [Puia sp.]
DIMFFNLCIQSHLAPSGYEPDPPRRTALLRDVGCKCTPEHNNSQTFSFSYLCGAYESRFC